MDALRKSIKHEYRVSKIHFAAGNERNNNDNSNKNCNNNNNNYNDNSNKNCNII